MAMRLSKKQRGVYTGGCFECQLRRKAEIEDCSFDHEFGTEHAYVFRCPQCGEELENIDFEEND
jgi:transcription initiation factor IIE alpha subunit